ncbi:hypothetical protein [Brevundimonas sp. TWP2-3-2]|uniref:hypothetical protein n=1 Tax=Brevundimonas sp. TWP2-3-2 TaxID=2804648 RepID=UPI003CEB9CA7
MPGDNHLASAEAERILATTGRYYISGGLVRLVEKGGRVVGTERVNEQTLKNVLAELIDWERQTRENIWGRCDPFHGVVQTLLYGQDRHHLPHLASIARQPFFGADGQLVTTPGYDTSSCIYGAFDPGEFWQSAATVEEAGHCLAYLEFLFDEFEFETECDKAAAICAVLTAAIRPSLRVAPAFSITAPLPGAGKSLLADIISLFASPDEPYRISFPTSAEEAGKQLLAVYMEKPAVLLFDDMQTNWKSFGPLNRALTSPTFTDRVLGSNRTATVDTRVLMLGSGNGVTPENDMRRRVVTIRLTPRHETPSLRKFRGNPLAEMKRNRAGGVNAALGIITAHRAAGELDEKVIPIGSYEEWSAFCREPLIRLGLPDPAQSMIAQLSDDPDKEALAHFLAVWWKRISGRSVMVREIVAKAAEYPDLMEAIEDLPCSDGRWINRHKLGQYIAKNEGRWVDGFRIE